MTTPCDPIPIGPDTLPRKLIWQDEFTGPLIDGTKWNLRDNDTYGDDNNEEQRYFARNASIVGQQLCIVAKDEPTTGKRYTSGFLTTKSLGRGADKFAFTQGYIECCAALPKGGGFWPAFWLVGATGGPGWPAYGEYDIFEGYGTYPNMVETTVHWSKAGRHTQYGGWSLSVPGGNTTKHLYGLLWTPVGLTMFIDGVKVWDWKAADPEAQATLALPHTIDINVAVGGDGPRKYHGWDGTWKAGDLPGYMMVDYVRVWQS